MFDRKVICNNADTSQYQCVVTASQSRQKVLQVMLARKATQFLLGKLDHPGLQVKEMEKVTLDRRESLLILEDLKKNFAKIQMYEKMLFFHQVNLRYASQQHFKLILMIVCFYIYFKVCTRYEVHTAQAHTVCTTQIDNNRHRTFCNGVGGRNTGLQTQLFGNS